MAAIEPDLGASELLAAAKAQEEKEARLAKKENREEGEAAGCEGREECAGSRSEAAGEGGGRG